MSGRSGGALGKDSGQSFMTQDNILKIFEETGALLEGHFQLASGLHSPQYFQCAIALQYPKYTQLLCGGIAGHFSRNSIDVVVSPAIGGIVVGQEVGRQLGVRTIFAERKEGLMRLRRGFKMGSGERVMVCEDVITTGGSVYEVIDMLKNSGGIILGVGCIVDRSGGKAKFSAAREKSPFSLLQMDVITYD
ncbi:MAG: orotate phosphoribosyltransferase, partial [Bacteroidota bacterium]